MMLELLANPGALAAEPMRIEDEQVEMMERIARRPDGDCHANLRADLKEWVGGRRELGNELVKSHTALMEGCGNSEIPQELNKPQFCGRVRTE